MKKTRLQELAGIKKPLNEGNAWDRNEDGSLPTLADTTARYAARNQGVNEMDAMSQGDKMALQSAVNVLDPTTAGAIEDGYYALTDNLPNFINDLQKGISKIDNPRAKDMMEKELSIYKQIEQLVNQSMLGGVL